MDKVQVVVTEGDRPCVTASWDVDSRPAMNAWISRWLRYHTDTRTATITFPDGAVKVRGARA